MKKVTLGSVDFELEDSAAKAVKTLQDELSTAKKKLLDAEEEKKKEDEEAEKKKKDEEEAEKKNKESSNSTESKDAVIDTLQAKLDVALSRIPNADMLDTLLENRISTRDAAMLVDSKFDWVGKDCETIRSEIVAKHCPTVDTSKVSVDYIRAAFDMLAVQAKNNPSRVNALDIALGKSLHADTQGVVDIVAEARTKFCNRWNKQEDSK